MIDASCSPWDFKSMPILQTVRQQLRIYFRLDRDRHLNKINITHVSAWLQKNPPVCTSKAHWSYILFVESAQKQRCKNKKGAAGVGWQSQPSLPSLGKFPSTGETVIEVPFLHYKLLTYFLCKGIEYWLKWEILVSQHRSTLLHFNCQYQNKIRVSWIESCVSAWA